MWTCRSARRAETAPGDGVPWTESGGLWTESGGVGGGSFRHRWLTTKGWVERRMLVAFSVTPLGVGEDVGELVAEAVRVVRDSGLPNRTDAMFTTVEGDWDEAMAVVKRAVDVVAAKAPRVSVVLKADVRPGVTDALNAKVETVERYLRARDR